MLFFFFATSAAHTGRVLCIILYAIAFSGSFCILYIIKIKANKTRNPLFYYMRSCVDANICSVNTHHIIKKKAEYHCMNHRRIKSLHKSIIQLKVQNMHFFCQHINIWHKREEVLN